MDCGGPALTRRNRIWGTAPASVGAMLAGGAAPPGSTAAAQTIK
jgi:hypothetical protein